MSSSKAKASLLKTRLLSKSAEGASLLIGLQVVSRGLTFIVNQVLLRYLSPELLGISTQLEVYSISVLFFARESLRVAIQRQTDTVDGDLTPDEQKKSRDGYMVGRTAAGKTQAIVNLAYVSIFLGVLFSIFLAWVWLYMRTVASDSHSTILDTPYFMPSLHLYGIAAIFELLAEPCFVVAQQKSEFKIRATAESIATVLRCLMTCMTAIWAAQRGQDLGVLPFALGQGIYAVSLPIVYYYRVWNIASTCGFSLAPRSIYSR